MLSTNKVDGINGELAQLKAAVSKLSSEVGTSYVLEWIFKRTNSFDKKLLPTEYLQIHHPESIGDTALHIALNVRCVYKILSNKKIGLDDESSYFYDECGGDEMDTPIAKIVEKDYANLNVFSDPRFKLPNTLICSMFNIYKKSKKITNLADKNGISHFHIACMVNDCEMVKLYLDNGVSIDHSVNKGSPYFPGYTPLHFAVKFCSVQTLKLLLKHNANMILKDAKGMSALHLLLKNYIEFAAVAQKRFKLKSQEEDSRWDDPRSHTHSYKVAHDCYAEDYLKLKSESMIEMFLEKCSQEKMLVLDDLGLSYSHLVCTVGDMLTLEDLSDMDQCINIDSPLWPGYTPLHFAALLRDVESMKELMEKGVNMAIKNAEGATFFDIYVEMCEIENIYMLLSSHPVCKDILFSDGKTSLLSLVDAMKNRDDFEKFVNQLPRNFDIHIPYDSQLWPGLTPIHLAILFSRKDQKDAPRYDEDPKLIANIFRQSPISLYTQKLQVPIPLDYAFRLKRMVAVDDLLECYGSLENYSDIAADNQVSCLHVASIRGDYTLVEKLLSWGNDINVTYNGRPIDSANPGWTPLHFAVVENCAAVVKVLCRKGANVLAKDANGLTPIHLSLVSPITKQTYAACFALAFSNQCETRKKIANSLFSSSYFQDAVVDDVGLSHLHVACYCGLEVAMKKLVENGADINKVINYKPKAGEKKTYLSSLTEFDGATPLYLALQHGEEEIVKSLLQLGPDVLLKSPDSKALLCDLLENNCNEAICDSNRLFFTTLLTSEDLRKLVEEKIGMTMLHAVCRLSDLALAEDLLDKGADVNAQIYANSPIWSGYTPLHSLKYSARREPLESKVRKMVKLLLDRGADVTLTDAEGRTAVHVAYEHCSSLSAHDNYTYTSMLLRAQRDFSVNPRSIEGLTHFHVACGLNDLFVVEKFLRHADIDVNQRVECDFEWNEYDSTSAGYTPLHFALSKRTINEITCRLEIVDLLLKRGANVHAEDACGDTPLNRAARCSVTRCQQLVERLIRNGADACTRSIFGKAPLEHLILKKSEMLGETYEIMPEEILDFLKCGCHFNEYNPAKGKGYLALALLRLSYGEMQYLIASVRINYPDAMKPKYKGRTAIHNIVSGDIPNIYVEEYAALIDQLETFDCNVDDQDDEGQTALHLAVQHQNAGAVRALILVGADISIHDSHGKDALAYNPSTCSKCDSKSDFHYKSSRESDDEVKVDYDKCHHIDIHQSFFAFETKIQLSKASLGHKTYGRVDPKRYSKKTFNGQLKKIKNLKIGFSTIDFGEFLSDNGAVIKYSTMSAFNREAIDDFFSNDIYSFRVKFHLLTDVIQYQYRKAVKRWKLVEESKDALVALTGYRLPELCSQYILQFLSISDLKNFVNSVV